MNDNRKPGFFKVFNAGLFVARFTADFNLRGAMVHKDSGEFTLGYTRRIDIPGDATGITLKIFIATFFATWAQVSQHTFAYPSESCYVVYGYTFAPFVMQTPCGSSNANAPSLNPCCCNPCYCCPEYNNPCCPEYNDPCCYNSYMDNCCYNSDCYNPYMNNNSCNSYMNNNSCY